MEWNWEVNTHDKYGDITQEGIYIQCNDTASIRFEDPTDLARFLDSVQNTMDEITLAWRDSAVDE